MFFFSRYHSHPSSYIIRQLITLSAGFGCMCRCTAKCVRVALLACLFFFVYFLHFLGPCESNEKNCEVWTARSRHWRYARACALTVQTGPTSRTYSFGCIRPAPVLVPAVYHASPDHRKCLLTGLSAPTRPLCTASKPRALQIALQQKLITACNKQTMPCWIKSITLCIDTRVPVCHCS